MTERIYRVAIIGLGRMGSTIDDEFPERGASLLGCSLLPRQ